jgi:hypothetical protein
MERQWVGKLSSLLLIKPLMLLWPHLILITPRRYHLQILLTWIWWLSSQHMNFWGEHSNHRKFNGLMFCCRIKLEIFNTFICAPFFFPGNGWAETWEMQVCCSLPLHLHSVHVPLSTAFHSTRPGVWQDSMRVHGKGVGFMSKQGHWQLWEAMFGLRTRNCFNHTSFEHRKMCVVSLPLTK